MRHPPAGPGEQLEAVSSSLCLIIDIYPVSDNRNCHMGKDAKFFDIVYLNAKVLNQSASS
jgi:hypothetical protein